MGHILWYRACSVAFTADQLRAIADVSDKYQVPEMKVTGGQRIDLFGVHKEDLPSMWRDLSAAGFIGHAYGKARTVKTCAGKNWCRFGTQDSTGLGVQLEELTWGSWMPTSSSWPYPVARATVPRRPSRFRRGVRGFRLRVARGRQRRHQGAGD